MSVRFDANSDTLSRTTDLPSQSAYTVCGWARVTARRSSMWETICTMGESATDANDHTQLLFRADDAGQFSLNSAGGFTNFASSPAVGEWFFWALRMEGTGAGQVTGYWRGLNASSFVTVASSQTSFTPAHIGVGSNTWVDEWLNGRIAAVKAWNAVLTAAELEREMLSYRAVRRADLYLETPLVAATVADNVTDFSGNARNWTIGGTLTVEDGPPILWAPGRGSRFSSFVSAGGGDTGLTVADGAFALSLDAPALTQANTLSVNALAFGLAIEAPALVQANTLAPSDAAIALGIESPALTQQNSLAVQDTALGLSLEAPTLTQANTLVPQDAAVALTIDNPTLGAGATLAPQDAAIGLALDAPSLSQANVLAVQDSAIALGIESPTLSLATLLALSDIAIALGLEAPILLQANNLVVQDGRILLGIDAPSLVQANTLALQDLLVALTIDELGSVDFVHFGRIASLRQIAAIASVRQSAAIRSLRQRAAVEPFEPEN